MSEYLNTTKELIGEIKKISDTAKVQLKPLVLKLADHIAEGLRNKKPEAVNQAKLIVSKGRYSNDPTNIKNVSKILKALRDQYFPAISVSHIEKSLPDEYKETRNPTEKTFDVNEITDRDLIANRQEIQKRIRDLEPRGPAQDYKVKTPKDVEEDDSEFPLKTVWLKIYNDMYEDWKSGRVSKDIFKLLKRRFKTIADKRFATDEAKYEAIILASSTYDSLHNSTKYETEILNPWERYDREMKCLKCYGDLTSCRAEKCSCACHEGVKHLTTKGLKWAIEHSPHLKKLDEQINYLSEWEDNVCSFGKILLRNPHTSDYMSKTDMKKIMSNHILKDKCETCEFFLDEHPDFFDNIKSYLDKE